MPATRAACAYGVWQGWVSRLVVLAARRAEVDRRNTARQELLAARGRLGAERLQVEDLKLAVGDRVVCGHNAIGELGWPTAAVAPSSPSTPRPDIDDPPDMPPPATAPKG
jgi:hypothetical protein